MSFSSDNIYGELTTTFIDAIRRGDKALKEIEQHLDQGMNVDADEGWPLITACLLGHLGVVKLLIRHGADVQVRNNECIILASKSGHTEIMQLLLTSRQSSYPYCSRHLLRTSLQARLATQPHSDKKNFILVALSNAIENKDIETTKLLLECGVSDSTSANELLRAAISSNDLVLTKFLLKLGANPPPSMSASALTSLTAVSPYRPLLLAGPTKNKQGLTVTEKFIKSWLIYTQTDKYFSLQDMKRNIYTTGDKNVITILESYCHHRSATEADMDLEERIITIYLSNIINLEFQEGFEKYKKSLEGYKKTITENLSRHLNRDVVQLVVQFL